MSRTIAALALVACAAGSAGAHGRSVSQSRWTIDGTEATVELRVTRRDLALRGIGDAAAYAASRLVLAAGGAPCRPGAVKVVPSAAAWVSLTWTIGCDGPPDRIDNHLFVDAVGARLHFARIARAGGPAVERVFGPSDVSMPLPTAGASTPPESPSRSIRRYVVLGIEHIVTGWDHLAFLAGLIVLAATVRDVLVLATGFTIGHSVTLALSVLGIARPEPAAVEALIGFSILLVATENVWLVGGRGRAVPGGVLALLGGLMAARAAGRGAITETTLAGLAIFTAAHFGLLAVGRRPERLRAAVAFGFGLVHGFGFAGILRQASLPDAAVLPALLGFNAGVELGQLGAITLAWPALILLRRVGRERVVSETVSAALAGLGTLWFVGRAFGG